MLAKEKQKFDSAKDELQKRQLGRPDIKFPLNQKQTTIESLRRRITALEREKKEFVDDINGRIKRLRSQIKKLSQQVKADQAVLEKPGKKPPLRKRKTATRKKKS
jgi:hypothetical protein